MARGGARAGAQAAVLEAYDRRQAELQENEGASAEVVDAAAGAARAAVSGAKQLHKAAVRCACMAFATQDGLAPAVQAAKKLGRIATLLM